MICHCPILLLGEVPGIKKPSLAKAGGEPSLVRGGFFLSGFAIDWYLAKQVSNNNE